jgi:shikimate kinase
VTSQRNNLFLVGMMGAGKSAVGRQLSTRLGMDFVDVDHEIQTRTGVSIAVIFDIEGEDGFRKREEQVIDELTQLSNVVLATGGGAVLSATTRARLKERGFTIYLHAKVTDLWHRTRNDRHRPLLDCEDPKKRLEELMEAREGLYREVADLIVETGRPSVTRLVEVIVERLYESGGERLASGPGATLNIADASP